MLGRIGGNPSLKIETQFLERQGSSGLHPDCDIRSYAYDFPRKKLWQRSTGLRTFFGSPTSPSEGFKIELAAIQSAYTAAGYH
jgi:hypothetical protein